MMQLTQINSISGHRIMNNVIKRKAGIFYDNPSHHSDQIEQDVNFRKTLSEQASLVLLLPRHL